MSMSRSSGNTRSAFGRVLAVLLVVWLVIGAIAAGQRGYYSSGKPDCAGFATIAVTIIAGPLNYVGVNPKTTCPHPSK
jgi:membrane protein YdbS with pleckstrin-like domain